MKFILIFSLFYLFQSYCCVKFISFLVSGKMIIFNTSFYQNEKREKRRYIINCVISLYTSYFVPVTRGYIVRLETRSI